MRAFDLVVGHEGATERGIDAQHGEEFPRYAQPTQSVEPAGVVPHPVLDADDRREMGEGLLAVAPVQIVLRHRVAGLRPLRVVFEDGQNPIVLVEGQSAEHHGIDDGEDRGARRRCRARARAARRS